MFAENDVIAISSLISSGNFWLRILKGGPRLYIHVQLTLFVYLEWFRRYSTFLAGISLLVATFWGVLGQTAFIEPLCVTLSLSDWPAQVRKKQQAGRKKSQEVYISRRPTRGATPSGWIPTKLGKCVRLTDVIKRAKFHRYNLRVSELWGVEVSMLP